jgi:tight adherence protein C
VFVFAFFFIFMRRLLRWCASQRQQVIRKEVTAFLHLLRMLFDAGLSFEHTLQVIEQQGGSLIPNLSKELGVVLKRIQAGQERGEALAEMAEPLDIPELNDTIGMLKQVTRYGGNIRDSLIEYTKLVEERQISELREYVSKLSAKMTVVMVLFLFPALMIFVAGPGFIGLARALKGM